MHCDREVPRRHAEPLDRERKRTGHFRHSMVCYHRLGAARRARGRASEGALARIISYRRFARFPVLLFSLSM